MNKIDELKFIIGRFDHYFDSVNGKGNLYLTLNTFLLGGAIGGYAVLLTNRVCTLAWPELVMIGAIGVCNVIAYLYTMRAIYPFVSKHQGSSYIFYGDIAGRTETEWKTLFGAVQGPVYEQDLVHQAHQLAGGLQKKYKRMRTATWWMFVEFVCFILGIFYLVIKHFS